MIGSTPQNDSSEHPDVTADLRVVAFALPDRKSADRAIDGLSDRYEIAPPMDAIKKRLYVDTIDRRLAIEGSTFHVAKTPRGWRVVWSSMAGRRQRAITVPEPPQFAKDLPSGPFRKALAKVISVRRLLPVAQARTQGAAIGLCDRRGKTIARVAVERWSLPGKRTGPLALRVASIRGYEKQFKKVVRFLRDELQLGKPAAAHPLPALGLLEASPGAPPSSLSVTLEPEMRTDAALKRILRVLLENIRASEDGTKAALDTEFLHEFRVAVRRTRAALSRFKGTLPVRTVDRFKREFKWLGSITGPLRDLDVYVLKFDSYLKKGPGSLKKALEPVRQHLLRRQAEEQEILRRHLESARYRRLVQSWSDFLDRPVPQRTNLPNARRPIGEFAKEQIWKLQRRVLRDGRAIDDDTPSAAVHELRLDCKKLRYMMEFCRSLFEPGAMTDQIKALKRLQDNLGDFNDLEVQQGKLGSFAEEMEAIGQAPLETAMAMGQLIEQLKERQAEERRRFGQRFPEFDSPKNDKRARRLFRPKKRNGKK
ncbi:MAG: CHAD domain-containing protein [Planctomycetota bacterium]